MDSMLYPLSLVVVMKNMEKLENQVYTIHRKFNLLSAWLQTKFPEDPTFPRSLDLAHESDVADTTTADDLDLSTNNVGSGTGDVSEGGQRKIKITTPKSLSRRRKQVFRVRPDPATTATAEQNAEFDLKPCVIQLERLKSQDVAGSVGSEIETAEERTKVEEDDYADGDLFNADEMEIWEPNLDGDLEDPLSLPSEIGIAADEKTENPEDLQIVKNRKSRGKATSSSIPCPFCKKHYVRHFIVAHIMKTHADATPETFQALKESYNLQTMIKPCGPTQILRQDSENPVAGTNEPVLRDVTTMETAEKMKTLSTFEKRKMKLRGVPNKSSIPCPFCEKHYVRHHYIYHIQRLHPDKCTPDILRNLIKTYNLGTRINLDESSQNKDSDEPNSSVQEVASTSTVLKDSKIRRRKRPRSCTKRKSSKEPTGMLVDCPICQVPYVRKYVLVHIGKNHPDQATPETFQNLVDSWKTVKHKESKKTVKHNESKTTRIRSRTNEKSRKIKKDHPPCPICRREFSQFRSYRYHIKSIHPTLFQEKVNSGEFTVDPAEEDESTTTCHICGKVVKQTYLNGHIRNVHHPTTFLLCSFCGYRTKQSRLLRSHMLLHTEERKFKCNLCPYTARQSHGFEKHFRTMHNAVQLMQQCNLCGEFFKGTPTLNKHIRNVHNNERPYPCNQCDKAFKEKRHLKYHMTTHDNPNSRKRGLNKERVPKRRKPSANPPRYDPSICVSRDSGEEKNVELPSSF